MKKKIVSKVLCPLILSFCSSLSTAEEMQDTAKISDDYLNITPYDLESGMQQAFICKWWIPLFCQQKEM
ncbi:hypothetical protein [Microbulbifer sp. THAF38]|uniref:hypothetical protein n=1 Tax=Microbulbifer sp. THAF38 TaxID=2587856 RepID=UPI001267AABB|nr:hypothetical protein [Microbulbifer sp. THAF38]